MCIKAFSSLSLRKYFEQLQNQVETQFSLRSTILVVWSVFWEASAGRKFRFATDKPLGPHMKDDNKFGIQEAQGNIQWTEKK